MHRRATTAVSTAAVWASAALLCLASVSSAQTSDNGVTSVTSTLVSLSTSDSSSATITSTPTSVFVVTEPTYASTITTCLMPASGTSAESPEDTAQALPAGAECFEIIRSNGSIFEVILYSINSAGSTVVPGETSSATASSKSSTSSGTIAGAVVGSVLGALCLGVGALWLRKQRRSSRASGQWFQNSGGWVRDEKSQAHAMEMTPRGANV